MSRSSYIATYKNMKILAIFRHLGYRLRCGYFSLHAHARKTQHLIYSLWKSRLTVRTLCIVLLNPETSLLRTCAMNQWRSKPCGGCHGHSADTSLQHYMHHIIIITVIISIASLCWNA